MEQIIRINHINPVLNIGLVSWREAWLLSGPEKLYTEIYRDKLVFLLRGSHKRISYQHLKKGLIKKVILIPKEPLPF